jgi:hypothetical protein
MYDALAFNPRESGGTAVEHEVQREAFGPPSDPARTAPASRPKRALNTKIQIAWLRGSIAYRSYCAHNFTVLLLFSMKRRSGSASLGRDTSQRCGRCISRPMHFTFPCLEAFRKAFCRGNIALPSDIARENVHASSTDFQDRSRLYSSRRSTGLSVLAAAWVTTRIVK